MPIESHITENEINIKDLSLEQPKKESSLEFDAKRDITKEDWQKMKDMLANCKQVGRTLEYIKTASGMLILFPERKSEIVDTSEETWQHLVNFLETIPNIEQKTEFLSHLKQMYPEKFKQIPLNFAEQLTFAPSILPTLLDQLDKKDISSALEFAADSKTVFPDIDTAKHFSNENIGQIIGSIEKTKKATKWVPGSGMRPTPTWDYAVSQVIQFKILFPQRANELEITKDDWKEIKDRLNSHRKKGHYDYLAQLSANLKMATADKIISTDDGLVIVEHKESDLRAPSAPLPQTKKF